MPRTATLTIVNDDALMTKGTTLVGAGNSGVVKVIDGFTGVAKATIQAFPVGYKAGVRVATGDVNGDGVSDIITAPGPNGATTLRVFDGTNGTKLLGQLGEFAHGMPLAGGVTVAAGDVNGDNKADIIVGAGVGTGAQPHVRVFSGLDRAVLSEFQAFPNATHGVTVAVGDVSGDATPEIIVAAGAGGPGQVRSFTPAGSLLNTYSLPSGWAGGVSVAMGDINHDGKDDIIVGAGTARSAACEGVQWIRRH